MGNNQNNHKADIFCANDNKYHKIISAVLFPYCIFENAFILFLNIAQCLLELTETPKKSLKLLSHIW